MAKSKGKRSAAVDGAAQTEGKPTNPPATQPDAFPELDQSALASLTSNIEQRLKGDESAKNKSSQKQTKPVKAKESKKEAKPSEPKSNAKSDSKKGKKRDRNGEVIARQAAGDKEDAAKTDAAKTNGETGENDEDTLRQEILALGGSKEDYELLAGLESDSEEEGILTAAASKSKSKGSKSEESLREEVSRMMKGFDPSEVKDTETDSDTPSEVDDPPVLSTKPEKEISQKDAVKKESPKKDKAKKEDSKKGAAQDGFQKDDKPGKEVPQKEATKKDPPKKDKTNKEDSRKGAAQDGPQEEVNTANNDVPAAPAAQPQPPKAYTNLVS